LGLDDWARRRGRTDATILVNLQTHTIIDLLPDREVATVAAWLALHPEVQVLSRDRAGAYAEAIRPGAPQVTQVADRWHLLQNIGDAVERALSRRQCLLQAAAEAVLREAQDRGAILATSGAAEAFPAAPLERSAAERAAPRAQRHAPYAEVQALHRRGVSIAEIARRLHLARATARKLARAEACPERAPRQQLLAPFAPYLR
jgi:hypothetical protein